MANQMLSLSPNLMVADVNKTIDFYTRVLGFTKIVTMPEEGDLVWGMVKNGEVSLMFQRADSIKEEYPELASYAPGGGLTLYIHVSDLEDLFQKVHTNATVIKKIHKTPYNATEFSILDHNGYILTFSSM